MLVAIAHSVRWGGEVSCSVLQKRGGLCRASTAIAAQYTGLARTAGHKGRACGECRKPYVQHRYASFCNMCGDGLLRAGKEEKERKARMQEERRRLHESIAARGGYEKAMQMEREKRDRKEKEHRMQACKNTASCEWKRSEMEGKPRRKEEEKRRMDAAKALVSLSFR